LGDGIITTGEVRSTSASASAGPSHPDAPDDGAADSPTSSLAPVHSLPALSQPALSQPAEWAPVHRAVLECLDLQAGAAPQSLLARFFGVDPLVRAARRSYSGALAELALSEAFDGLGAEWTVVHSVPVGGDRNEPPSTLDHLIIGPAGIFSVAVLSHAGQSVWVGERTFIVNDERLGHLASAEEWALATGRQLESALSARGARTDVVVMPCLVVDSPARLEVHHRSGRIQVITARNFMAWLEALPRLASPTLVETQSTVALEASTWPARASISAADVMHQGVRKRHDDFDVLRLRVSSARFRRLIWAALGVIASYALVLAVLSGESAGQFVSALELGPVLGW